MKKKYSSSTELLEQINRLKSKMINCGIRNGLNSPYTVKYSQELDKLIIIYQKTHYMP
ncbi:aspartyl-phosphate phosphatase Spo0E family protein [Fredinandcohnia humi]